MKQAFLSILSSCVVGVVLLSMQAYCVPDNGSPMQISPQPLPKPEAMIGAPVDVAPFGEVRQWNEKSFGIVWEDARDVLKVVVKFADGQTLPDPATVKLQYWRDRWPQDRAPRDKLVGSGGSGWMEAGDWYNAKWKDADTEVSANGNEWTFTFRPINGSEYSDLGGFDVKYRTTMKLRLVFPDKAPTPASLQTLTDSTWQGGSLIVEWGGAAATGEQVWDGKVEAFNGYVAAARSLAGSRVRVNGLTWTSSVNKTTDGIVLDLLYAKPAAVSSFDETIVTIRAKQHSFSFCPREVADGKRIHIRDFGVMVKGTRDPTTFDQAEEAYRNAPKDIYRRVLDMPEQTLTGAWSAMPQKGRIYMPLSLAGARQHFRLSPTGDIQMNPNWLRRRPSTDSEKFIGGEVRINLGLANGTTTGASLEDDILPIATTWYEADGVRYSQEAFATTLSGKLPETGRVPAEEPLVAMVRFTITNSTDAPKTVSLPMNLRGEKLTMRDGLIYAKSESRELLRMMVVANRDVTLTPEDNKIVCSIELPAKGTRVYYVKIPYLVLDSPEDISRLKKLSYDAQHKMIANHWRKQNARSSQVTTPDAMINQFYAANASHQLINSESEIGNTGRLMAKVGTFAYGVFSNESVMMASELDRRGYHDEAERVYEAWIHYQGTVALPGDYTTHEGEFYGANRYEDGGYNQHHGWVLWGLGEHYWFTRDGAWLDRVAPNIIKGCDWIIKQRARTKTDECTGIRAIEYGLLPPGSLEDIGDWRSWMSNNVFSWWGMDNAARALVDRGHPEGQRLLKEAQDYGKDIRAAFFEAMTRSPVVALRDGTHIPNMPSEVHRRGRSFGWITETLEGSIHMVRCGLIAPDEPAAKWIMQDFEDNRYLSDQFGYQAADFEKEWFGIGGFSQQPSLLCSPTPYIQRDEPEHYIRTYFNAFAAGYFPERQMLTEHPLPNLGDFRGDHFKSSDEAMNTSWIRWMFVWDEGQDLYLGKTIPRYWLADGKTVKIERTATHFGSMSMTMTSRAASGRIEMTINPPTRNEPRTIYARFRHPQGKKMTRVTVDGKPWTKFDVAKEWVVLPALKAKTVVVAYYQ